MRDYIFESFSEMTDFSDVVVKGHITDVYVGEVWKGAQDDPGSPFPYARIAIDDVLKGHVVTRMPDTLEVQLMLVGEDWQPPDAATIPGGETLFFLKHEATYRQKQGLKPRETDIAPYAYFIPVPEAVIREVAGSAHVIKPERMAREYGEDYYPLEFEGASFDELVQHVAGLVSE